jgi:excisionase family DNA binding protein
MRLPVDTSVVSSFPKGARPLVDMKSLSEWLGTSTRHIRRLVSEKRVPFVKVGHFVRFDPDDIARWIEGQKVTEEPVGAGGQPPWVRHSPGTIEGQFIAPRAKSRQAPTSENTNPPWLAARKG